MNPADTFPDPGLFVSRLTRLRFDGRPALFLDRDGVLVEEVDYLHRTGDVRFVPGVAETIAQANRADIPVVMVTNQAGIGRGYYGLDQFHAVQEHIFDHFARRQAHFDMALACAYHADGRGEYAMANHAWRKPNPGMLLEASRTLGTEMARSFIVGDTLSDLAAGEAAGLWGGALVMTGHGEREWSSNGAARFEAWRRQGRFDPQRAGTAAEAISAWLGRLA